MKRTKPTKEQIEAIKSIKTMLEDTFIPLKSFTIGKYRFTIEKRML